MYYFTVYYKGCKIDEVGMVNDIEYSARLKVLDKVHANIEIKEVKT